jgi:hypothetical protein
MPITKEIGRLFTHRFTYPPGKHFPLIDLGSSQEIEYPFRSGRSLVVRIPFTRESVVLGIWGEPEDDPDTALQKALRLWEEEEDVQEEE